MHSHEHVGAAMYVRMSTESQDYSTDHQRAKIRRYAQEKGLQIVKEYIDEGRSGLDIKRRSGLQNLIADVQSGQASFKVIVVYDVSRWGRFQDIDEAAYYEHTCRRAGIQIFYCAEQFGEDATPIASLLKSIKRTMAAEYSRELSAKVFEAQCRFIRYGFKQGGHAGYGLRRLAVTQHGLPRRVLDYGEAKGNATDRVVLILGPDHEVQTVRRMYELYLAKMSEPAIARMLNEESILSEFNRPWTAHMVKTVLTNAKYMGTLAYNRRSCKLSKPRRPNPPRDWVVNEDAIEPLLPRSLFEQAQRERARRIRRYQPDELIGLLQACWQRNGKISAKLIAADPQLPDPQLFVRTFGSLIQAYDRAGIPRSASHRFVETKKRSLMLQHHLIREIVECATAAGGTATVPAGSDVLLINESVKVWVEVATKRNPTRGSANWKVRPRSDVDFVISARLDPHSNELLDYFLIPAARLAAGPMYLKESSLPALTSIRHTSVGSMFGQ